MAHFSRLMRIFFTCVYDGHTRRQHLCITFWKLRLNMLRRLAMMPRTLAMTYDIMATKAAGNLKDVQDVAHEPQIDTAFVSA